MKTIKEVLIYLDGKKTYIASMALLVIPFLVSQGLVSNEVGVLIAGIISILAGGGKYATDKFLGKAKRTLK